jgi:hypothetical protein
LDDRIGTLVVIVLLLLFGWAVYSAVSRPPAQLDFSVQLSQVRFGDSVSIPVTVHNQGGPATGVSVDATSDALESFFANAFDLSSGSTYIAQATARAADKPDGFYSLAIRLSWTDSAGSHVSSWKNYTIILLPAVEVRNVHWTIRNWVWAVDTIGQTDNTTLYFKIGSRSTSSIYSGMVAKLVLLTQGSGISTGPPIAIPDLGPSGVSREFSFSVSTNNTPPGKYKLSITLMAGDQKAAEFTVELTVEAR